MNGPRILIWWLGWNPKIGFIAGAIVGAAGWIWLGLGAGMFFGLPVLILWILGVQWIGREAGTELLRVENLAWQAGLRELGVDPSRVQAFILRSARGRKVPMVKPLPEYVFTVLFVGDTFVAISGNWVFDLPSGTGARGDQLRVIYFRNVASLEFRDLNFEIHINTGECLRWPSNADAAAAALAAIRPRFQLPSPVQIQNLGAQLAVASPAEPPTTPLVSSRPQGIAGRYCERCGIAKEQGQQLCPGCGGQNCPACGHVTPAEDDFCDTCGHLLQSETENGSLSRN